METNPARERVLTTAEKLFSERGYAAVTLRDIADALGIKQASLYYHVPGGKEALFVEVTLRGMERHRAGLEAAITSGGSDLAGQLRAAARWLLSQPAMNFGRMMQSDMPAIGPEHAERLRRAANRSLLAPLEAAFAPYIEQSDEPRTTYVAGAFLAIVESIHALPPSFSTRPRDAMADYLIDILVNGLERTQEIPK